MCACVNDMANVRTCICDEGRRARAATHTIVLVLVTTLTYESSFTENYSVRKLSYCDLKGRFFIQFHENPPTHFVANQSRTLNMASSGTASQNRHSQPQLLDCHKELMLHQLGLHLFHCFSISHLRYQQFCNNWLLILILWFDCNFFFSCCRKVKHAVMSMRAACSALIGKRSNWLACESALSSRDF